MKLLAIVVLLLAQVCFSTDLHEATTTQTQRDEVGSPNPAAQTLAIYKDKYCGDPSTTFSGDFAVNSDESYKAAQSLTCITGELKFTRWDGKTEWHLPELKYVGNVTLQGTPHIVGLFFPKLEAADRLFLGSPSYPNPDITTLDFSSLQFARTIQLGDMETLT